MNVYKTHEVARIINIHVNTVRLYEKWKLISKPERLKNGYRIFTDLHIEQFHLARAALKTEIFQNGLRKQAINIIKISALGNFHDAKQMANLYLKQIDLEINHAEEAINITQQILNNSNNSYYKQVCNLTRKEVANHLTISVDTLRNWELNGLITIKHSKNKRLIYSYKNIQLLKIIRSLRCANYSLSAILRMIKILSQNPTTNLKEIINTPNPDEDVITACDKLLTSLVEAKNNMIFVLTQIEKIEKMKK